MTAFGRSDYNLLLFGDFSRLIWLVLFLEIRLSDVIAHPENGASY
jgi:hypothetical protein